MNETIVTAYGEELSSITGRIAEMGGLAETSIQSAIHALKRQDLDQAETVILQDRRLDEMQHKLEDQIILLIAKRQPVAADLRSVVAALRITNDLERIGDLAKNIAKRVILIEDLTRSHKLVHGVENLSKLSQMQLKNVLDAFVKQDVKLADQVRKDDKDIDDLYTSLFREFLTYMIEDPRNISMCTHLLFCAKNIERIGDHATNIAENVHYMVTGEMPDSERPKADELTSHTKQTQT